MSGKNARISMDFTIVDPYGNTNHVCKDCELISMDEFDDGLDEFCETFKLLLVQSGYCFLEGKEIKFV